VEASPFGHNTSLIPS